MYLLIIITNGLTLTVHSDYTKSHQWSLKKNDYKKKIKISVLFLIKLVMESGNVDSLSFSLKVNFIMAIFMEFAIVFDTPSI